jgi:hypothetical protein
MVLASRQYSARMELFSSLAREDGLGEVRCASYTLCPDPNDDLSFLALLPQDCVVEAHKVTPSCAQDHCCTVLIGGHQAHDVERLDELLDDPGALVAGGGAGPRLHAFDHRFPSPANASAPQV